MAKKSILVVLVGIALLVVTDSTFAFGRHPSGRPGGGHRDGGHSRGGHRGHFGPGVIIIPPRIRPVVVFPPRGIIIRPTIVFGPTTTVRETVEIETVVVWVANDNGSKTQVTLTRASDGGYIGPKGEHYTYMPTEEQLRALYGIKSEQAIRTNITVWITNDNGSQTPVTLIPSGAGFIGPSNEYYATIPTEEQLKALYGLRSNVPAANSITVWFDNNDGTKTPVVLVKDGDDYVGQKGEHYTAIPTKEQLKMIYGDKPKKIDCGNIVIWIDNSDGSRTPITLQKQGSEYIGPAGEKYTSIPTEQQLRLLYGSEIDKDQPGELNFEITKDDGTKTVITLKKEGSEFVGPKGERYPTMPTEEQLKLIYGK